MSERLKMAKIETIAQNDEEGKYITIKTSTYVFLILIRTYVNNLSIIRSYDICFGFTHYLLFPYIRVDNRGDRGDDIWNITYILVS